MRAYSNNITLNHVLYLVKNRLLCFNEIFIRIWLLFEKQGENILLINMFVLTILMSLMSEV